MIPGTHIAYLFLPSVDDDHLRQSGCPRGFTRQRAGWTASSSINAKTSGALSTVVEKMLGFFTGGTQGYL